MNIDSITGHVFYQKQWMQGGK